MPAALIAVSLASDAIDAYPHPQLPPPGSWPGVVVIVIVLGFFALAALLGPIVRATMREQSRPRKPLQGPSARTDLISPPSDSTKSPNGNTNLAPLQKDVTRADHGD